VQHRFRMNRDPLNRSVLQQHIDYFDHDGAAPRILGGQMDGLCNTTLWLGRGGAAAQQSGCRPCVCADLIHRRVCQAASS